MSDHLDVERGQLAQSVLDNRIYIESYALVEQEITRKWRESRDANEREQLHQLLLMLGKARSALETVMRTGKLAAAEIARKQSLANRIGSALRAA